MYSAATEGGRLTWPEGTRRWARKHFHKSFFVRIACYLAFSATIVCVVYYYVDKNADKPKVLPSIRIAWVEPFSRREMTVRVAITNNWPSPIGWDSENSIALHWNVSIDGRVLARLDAVKFDEQESDPQRAKQRFFLIDPGKTKAVDVSLGNGYRAASTVSEFRKGRVHYSTYYEGNAKVNMGAKESGVLRVELVYDLPSTDVPYFQGKFHISPLELKIWLGTLHSNQLTRELRSGGP